jgi:DDE superfamily endonuclease/Helix-turn-helix of DDE superfamily endonuclease
LGSDVSDGAALVLEELVEYGPEVPTAVELLQLLSETRQELSQANQKLKLCRFGLERYSNDKDKLKFYVGFVDYKVLVKFFDWLQPAARNMAYPYSQKVAAATVGRQRALVLFDEFFLVLCRLHAGLLVEDLADRFNVSVATVSRIFLAWINLLYVVLGSINIWPSRESINNFMPPVMCEKFPSVRVIIDCTEIFTQKPSSLVGNSQLFSSYKNHTTFKGLIGIAPHGTITFVSSLFSGCISDVEMTKVCGVLNLLEAGDSVMADKGFTIAKLLSEQNVGLVIPHFLSAHTGQFTDIEVANNDSITASRVHVERAIRRVKENRILQGIIPLTMVGSINQIWTVCCLLTNFRSKLF